ncbi:carboxypeptidase regulatory-like domain-containing protein [bacterium]|nr:carboxypeptidase regulatory-like domain-containing protein [bacterium]
MNNLYKNRRSPLSWVCILTALVVLFQGSLFGQGITSSALKGRVTGNTGNGIPGVEITVTHEPTGSVQTTSTNSSGRYTFRGLRVGGPYTILARSVGYTPRGERDVSLELSRTYEADFILQPDESVVTLEAFTVEESSELAFGNGSAGVGTVLGENGILTTPKANRSFNDIAKFDPRVVMLDASSGAGSISAAGQHIKMNSFQIDGVRINDQFGLGSDGSPALANPISMDTIDEIAVEVSPYDTRQSGFTGASINAVTKSGTNDFTGSVYYFFEDENTRGENPISGLDDVFEETTWGATFGGPIIPNKLYFFGSYEELERNTAGPTPGFVPDPAELERTIAFVQSEYGFDPGTWGLPAGSTVPLADEKSLVKLDWIINGDHRASLRWNKTKGNQPQFSEYADFSSSQPETNLTSHWYTDNRTNESVVFQMFSNWGDNWRTEFRYGQSEFISLPGNPNVFPEIVIDDFPGTTRSGAPTSRGELYFGRDDSRHSNELATDVTNIYLAADYFTGDHTITFGFDREESDFVNLFLQQTFGEMTFDNVADFYADEIQFFRRSVGVDGVPLAAESDFTTNGLFIQDTWDVNNRLTVNFGLRYDFVTTDRPVSENPGRNGQSFEQIFGTPNTNTMDGSELLAPRFSFQLDVDDEGLTKITGGLGLFMGRNPWVWVSNAYSNTGLNSTDFFSPPSGNDRVNGGGLKGYLDNDFDPENAVLFVSQDQLGTGRSTIALLAPDFDLPSIWKGNLNIEHRLSSESPWMAYAEMLVTKANTSIYTSNINLREIGTTPDGRTRFAGSLRTAANGNSEAYNDVYQLNNSSQGESLNYTFGVRRSMRNNWSTDFSYTYGDSKDISNQGSSTAWSNFAGNPIYNQNTPELGTSAYETEHRVLARLTYNMELAEGWDTNFNLTYIGQSGQNYSLLFDNDFNGDDADFDNDLLYVPSGPNDSIIDTANSSGLTEMFAYLDSLGVQRGQVVGRNSLRTDWRNNFDLNITQNIPMRGRLQGQVYLNVLNVANLLNSKSGIINEVPFGTLAVASGTISPDGSQIAYSFNGGRGTSIRTGRYAQLSRWRIQTGFKLLF